MPQIAFVNDNKITLRGQLSREEATELRKLLSERLKRLLEQEPLPERVVLDLSEVAEIDACGCQLLILFMENLRRRGVPSSPCGLRRQLADQIAHLGFSEAFPGEPPNR